MLTKSCLLLTSLAASALAAPQPIQARATEVESFFLYANATNDNSLFGGKPKVINGNNLGLWIGKPTTANTSVSGTEQNTTVFWADTSLEAIKSQIHLSVTVSNGQILYHDTNKRLSYTAAGENSIPAQGASITYGYSYTPQDTDESTADWGYVKYIGSTFHACPDLGGEGEYYITVVADGTDPQDCTYIELLGVRWTAGTAAYAYL